MSRDATIAALTPLARLRDELCAALAACPARRVPPAEAIGAILAEDVVAAAAVPAAPLALIAGHAVASLDTVGASPYAPATPSRTAPVGAGAALPAGCDAVVPAEAIGFDFGFVTVQQAVAPGDGIRRTGEDVAAGSRLATAGTPITPRLALILDASGCASVAIRRPRVALRHGAGTAAAARFLAATLGDAAEVSLGDLADPSPAADLVLFLGGAEIGGDDPALAVLASTGIRLGHGLALTVAESLAWGTIADRPALVLPSRPEAVIVIAAALVEPALTAAATTPAPPAETRALARKLVSRVGMSEIALLARDGDLWRPLATGDLPWWAIATADALVELPPESEGHAAGTPLAARLLTRRPLRSNV